MNKFTLIELLVVTAIIGILSSLLLPSLSKTRGKARMQLCLNNMKQISYTINLYAHDNDGAAYHHYQTVNRELENAGIVNNGAGLWESPEEKGTWSYGGSRPVDFGFKTIYEAQKNSYLMNERYLSQKSYNIHNAPNNDDAKAVLKWLKPSQIPAESPFKRS